MDYYPFLFLQWFQNAAQPAVVMGLQANDLDFSSCNSGLFYPEQQLPGLPQELGLPQQPPGLSAIKPLPEPTVLWADMSFSRFWLLQDLQLTSSSFLRTSNSLICPQSLHLYS
jgi:hypothetical protein